MALDEFLSRICANMDPLFYEDDFLFFCEVFGNCGVPAGSFWAFSPLDLAEAFLATPIDDLALRWPG